MPDYTELVFVTSKENAEKNADKLTRFLRATKKGYEHVKANPEKGVENLLKNQNTENFPLNKDVETKSVATILSLAEKDVHLSYHRARKHGQTISSGCLTQALSLSLLTLRI